MMKKFRFSTKLAFALLILCTLSVVTAQPGDYRQKAKKILDTTGIKGGLIVHVGCGDGRLTAALRADESYLVHGLDTDAENVEKAREYIQSIGSYGNVSIDRLDGGRLPYVDNLVNLVVAESVAGIPSAPLGTGLPANRGRDALDTSRGVSMDEVMRVLTPNGIAYIKNNGEWNKTIKPRPSEIDEWTHFLHDSSGNAVAHDQVVGPPRHIQWVADPPHTRSHEHIPGIYALVSAGGRIFYIADEAAIESVRQAPKWQLIARDAFNGILLWKKPISTWFPHIVNWGQTPRQLQRRLVAVADRVYVTLGLHALAPEKSSKFTVSMPSEGRIERGPAYSQAENHQIPVINLSDWPTYRHDAQRSGCTDTSVSAKLRRQWQVKIGRMLSAPTVAEGKVFIASVDEHRISAIDADSGQFLWHFTAGARIDSPPTLYQGRATFGCRDGYVYSLQTSDGKLAWRLLTAPDERRIAACGQLESASPAHGSVLARNEVVYCTAGCLSLTNRESTDTDADRSIGRTNCRMGRTAFSLWIAVMVQSSGRSPLISRSGQ